MISVVVVVVVGSSNSKSINVLQTPVDIIRTVVVKSGTNEEEYPDSNEALLTPVSNAEENPSKFENKSKGPLSAPATVNVINTVIIY
jgi:hypothetical protein